MADVHVLPINDLRDHEETRLCWCIPVLIGEDDIPDMVVVHHSIDGRELVEEHGIN
jgi:hypothetical protein